MPLVENHTNGCSNDVSYGEGMELIYSLSKEAINDWSNAI